MQMDGLTLSEVLVHNLTGFSDLTDVLMLVYELGAYAFCLRNVELLSWGLSHEVQKLLKLSRQNLLHNCYTLLPFQRQANTRNSFTELQPERP